jgi:hypothetical protein
VVVSLLVRACPGTPAVPIVFGLRVVKVTDCPHMLRRRSTHILARVARDRNAQLPVAPCSMNQLTD